MRRGLAAAITVVWLARAAFAWYWATPALYTDGNAVTCTMVNLHANGQVVRLWVVFDGFHDEQEFQTIGNFSCPGAPTPVSGPEPPPSQRDAYAFPPNSCYYYCGQLAKGQSCTTPPIYPPAGHAVTCTAYAYGTTYDGNDVLLTLSVGNLSTSLRGEG